VLSSTRLTDAFDTADVALSIRVMRAWAIARSATAALIIACTAPAERDEALS